MTVQSGRQFKNEILELFVRIGKAVSNGKRIELLDLLVQGPRHVEAILGRLEIDHRTGDVI